MSNYHQQNNSILSSSNVRGSTSSRNTPGNFELEQRAHTRIAEWLNYPHAANGTAYTRNLPGDGLLAGPMNIRDLAKNYIEIESELLGIGVTNLEKPHTLVIPDVFNIPSLNIYQKNRDVLVPTPLQIIPGQRANYRN